MRRQTAGGYDRSLNVDIRVLFVIEGKDSRVRGRPNMSFQHRTSRSSSAQYHPVIPLLAVASQAVQIAPQLIRPSVHNTRKFSLLLLLLSICPAPQTPVMLLPHSPSRSRNMRKSAKIIRERGLTILMYLGGEAAARWSCRSFGVGVGGVS